MHDFYDRPTTYSTFLVVPSFIRGSPDLQHRLSEVCPFDAITSISCVASGCVAARTGVAPPSVVPIDRLREIKTRPLGPIQINIGPAEIRAGSGAPQFLEVPEGEGSK